MPMLNQKLRRPGNARWTIVSNDRGFKVLVYCKDPANNSPCKEINQPHTQFKSMQAGGIASSVASSSSSSIVMPVASVTDLVLSYLKSPSTSASPTDNSVPLTIGKTVEPGKSIRMPGRTPRSKERCSSRGRRKVSTSSRITEGKKRLSPRDQWVKNVARRHGLFKFKNKVQTPNQGTRQPRPVAGPSRHATLVTGPSHTAVPAPVSSRPANSEPGSVTLKASPSGHANPAASPSCTPLSVNRTSILNASDMSAKARGKQHAQDLEIEQTIPLAGPSRAATPVSGHGLQNETGHSHARPLSLQSNENSSGDETPSAKTKGKKRARDDDEEDESRPRTKSRKALSASSLNTPAAPSRPQIGQRHIGQDASAGPPQAQASTMSAKARGKQPARGTQAQPATPVAINSLPQPLRRESTVIDFNTAPSSTGTSGSSSSRNQTLLPMTRGKKRTRDSEDEQGSSRGRPRRRGADQHSPPPRSAFPRSKASFAARGQSRQESFSRRLGRGSVTPSPLRSSYVPPKEPGEKSVGVLSSVFRWISPYVPK